MSEQVVSCYRVTLYRDADRPAPDAADVGGALSDALSGDKFGRVFYSVEFLKDPVKDRQG